MKTATNTLGDLMKTSSAKVSRNGFGNGGKTEAQIEGDMENAWAFFDALRRQAQREDRDHDGGNQFRLLSRHHYTLMIGVSPPLDSHLNLAPTRSSAGSLDGDHGADPPPPESVGILTCPI
eukprot:SAG31_NODE_2238_length_6119_cov_3.847508_6_plen_121_part_00